MKAMRNLAVVGIAAALAMAMSSVAFAATIEDNDGPDSNTANVELGLNVTENKMADTYSGDINKKVWNVVISADSLTWNVEQQLSADSYELTWDTTTHKYTKGNKTDGGDVESTALASGEATAKNFTITNHSNFDVTPTTAVNNDSRGLFSVAQDASGALAAGATARTVTVTLNTTALGALTEKLSAITNTLTGGSTAKLAGNVAVTLGAGDTYANSGAYEAQ